MSYREIFIKNAKIICGNRNDIITGGLLITFFDKKGIISKIGADTAPHGAYVIDADGSYILPVFADIGCRFFDPDYPSRESFSSAESAAIGGGFGAVLCEPDEQGRTIADNIISQSQCRLIPSFSIESYSFSDIIEKGFYSDNGKWIGNSYLMRKIMLSIAENDGVLISSCFDSSLAGEGIVSAGKASKLLGLPTIPISAETTALSRDIILSAETGCRLHVKAVASAESIKIIKQAKTLGIPVTCGTAAPYFSMTSRDVLYYGGNAKLIPPLHSSEDVDAVRQGLLDGTIDCISSLHTPLTRAEKGPDIQACRFGISGLDTAFPAYISYMMKNGFGDMLTASRIFSVNPSKILGIDSTLKEGKEANFVILNPDHETVVSSNTLKSKSVNTAFLGMTLMGSVEATFLSGIRF